MIPNCCVCGQFTTHYYERYANQYPYSEDDRWYCPKDAPIQRFAEGGIVEQTTLVVT